MKNVHELEEQKVKLEAVHALKVSRIKLNYEKDSTKTSIAYEKKYW